MFRAIRTSLLPKSLKTPTTSTQSRILNRRSYGQLSSSTDEAYRVLISTSRKKAKELDERNISDIRVYTDGSKSEEGIGGSAVVLQGKLEVRCKATFFIPGPHWTSSDAECLSMLLGLHILRRQNTGFASASISVDNRDALKCVDIDDNFGSEHRHFNKVQLKWREPLQNATRDFQKQHPRSALSFIWVPNRGCIGNRWAHREANKAREGALRMLSIETDHIEEKLKIKGVQSLIHRCSKLTVAKDIAVK